MSINFKNVSFLKSVSINTKEVYFDDKKEIVFIWRSNMGKSSLMNAIFEKKDLVKTSAKPGKTRLANIFVVENKYYFTDLPWYWFAKLGKNLKDDLDALISWYLEERRENIKKVVILIDSKLWPQKADFEMFEYLLDLELPLTIILSKADKLSKNELNKSVAFAKESFFWQEVIACSSKKKIWLDEFKKSIKRVLSS